MKMEGALPGYERACVVEIFGWVLQGLGRVLFRSGLGGMLPLRLNWRSLRGVVGLCVR